MITEIIEDYLETGSGRLVHIMESGHLKSHLTIVPHSGATLIPTVGLDKAKFSFNVISGAENIIRVDNDHSIDVSGAQFLGLHEHEFVSEGTRNRIPLKQIDTIGKAGSYAHNLWEKLF